jgi:hypothetical protein
MINLARQQLNKALKNYPSLTPDIMEAWELTRDEIASGESEDNEAEHFMSWLDQRIEEHINVD